MESTSSAIGQPQHLGALERANRVRSARATLKRRIADGELTAADAVLSHRWEIDRMPIGEVLSSQRGWGQRRCQQFLAALAIDETKTLGSMTERQRLAAAARLSRNRAIG
jgi:hypothetical protein